MSEWRRATVEELAASGKNSLATGPFGSAISARYFTESGVPVIRGSNLSLDIGERLIDRELAFIPQNLAEKFARSRVRAGDLVFTCWGTIGQVGLIDDRSMYDEYIVSNKQMKLTPNPDLASSLFLYYAFSNPDFVERLQGISIGSSVPGFNLGQLRSMELVIPASAEQEAVAAVLGALDDKIAINERITSTSDELGSALLEKVLLEDSDLSSVPLGSIADVNRRKVSPVIGGTLRYVDISSVTVGIVKWPGLSSWDDAPGRARRGVSVGDTIWSTVRPNRRSFAIILDDDPQLVVSTGFAVLTPVKVGAAFLYEVTKRDEFVQYLESVAEGSAYPAVRAERFDQAIVPVPSRDRLQKFESVAMPLRERAHAAAVESRSLAALRDTLLPKLMSGEIRVRDAEKVVEDVVLWRAGCRRRSGKTSSWSGSRSLGGSRRTARTLPKAPASVNPGMS
jgi:type I restriction enzyme, S subunit